MSKQLSLRVHKVTCRDETNGKYVEMVGNDEIYLGGFAVNEKAETVQISPVSIYPHFDDGDVKVFNPPKVFHTFQMPTTGDWPKTYAVGLILIEKDAGGMVSAVKKITDFAKAKILEELAKEKKKAEAKVNPGIVGSLALGPILLEALKAALPYILDFVIGKIMGAFADDVFKPQLATIQIPKADFNWGGTNDSAEKTVTFRDHSGIYDLTYDWRLV